MNIQQMHVEVRQEARQIGITNRRDFLPEQLDLVLNSTIDTFVDSCLRKRENGTYEITKEEDIQTLVVLDSPLILLPNPVRGLLPHDFWKFCSDSSLVLCGATTATTASKTLYVYKAITTTKAEAPYYAIAVTGAATLTIEGKYPTKDDYSNKAVRDVLISKLRQKGIKVWENLDGMQRDEFALEIAPTIKVDDVDILKGTISLTYLVYDQTGSIPTSNSLTPAELLHDRLFTPFYRSSLQNPVTALEQGKLRVYSPYSGIVTGLLLNYISKPATVSLALNSDCNLPASVHRRICKLAAEQLLSDTNDPGTASKVQFNNARSQPTL
jgi:hypothetical protein